MLQAVMTGSPDDLSGWKNDAMIRANVCDTKWDVWIYLSVSDRPRQLNMKQLKRRAQRGRMRRGN